MFFPAASFVQLKCQTIFRLFAFHVVLAAAVTESFSQDWFWKNPLPQGNDIHAMCSAGSGVLYAVGDFGTVIKSTNAGSNWFLLETSTTIDLHGVSFVTPDWGAVVGDAGLILQTTDGGATWIQHTIAVGATLYGVFFMDFAIGTVVGYPGIVLRTTDGGSTWQQQLAGGGDHLYATRFLDANRGTIVGSQGVIFRTTNAGKSWGRQVDSTTRNLYSISFPDSLNGFAVGANGLILHTSDGGKIWKPQQSGTGYLLKSVSFSDPNNGTIVGESGTILMTTNGGATWVSKPLGVFAFTAVHQIDAMNAVAIGFSGVAFRTTDGGSSWEQRSVGVVVPLYGVSVTDATHGIAVGLAGTVVTSGGGGERWTSRLTGTTENFRAIGSLNNDTAIAVGENGVMMRTEDGGLTWTDISLPAVDISPPVDTVDIYWHSGIDFSPGGNALVVGKLTRIIGRLNPFTVNLTPVLRSTDCGTTWSLKLISFKPADPELPPVFFSSHFFSVAFVDSNTAVAVGEFGRILRTTNCGVTWDSAASGTTETLTSVAFSKSRIGVGTAVGEGPGTVLWTTNGGVTWNRVQLLGQPLRSISYGDSTFAIATGDGGGIFYTFTGGKNWTRLSLLMTNKLMVHRTDKDLYGVSLAGGNIFLVGDGGIILGNQGPDIPVFVESGEPRRIPTSPALRQNYPNPFNPETTIEFHVERSGPVHLSVYDLLGRQVATLVDEMKSPGMYRVRWIAPWFPTGTYIVRLRQGELILSRRMLLIR